MSITIRKARLADVPALKEMWKQFIDLHKSCDRHFTRSRSGHLKFGKFATRMIPDHNSLILVAERDGRIVGYLTATINSYPPVYIDKRYGAIYDLMVDPTVRRKGLGQKLFSQARQWFRKKGMQRIELSVAVANLLAMRFWKKMGFRTYMERMYIKS